MGDLSSEEGGRNAKRKKSEIEHSLSSGISTRTLTENLYEDLTRLQALDYSHIDVLRQVWQTIGAWLETLSSPITISALQMRINSPIELGAIIQAILAIHKLLVLSLLKGDGKEMESEELTISTRNVSRKQD